MVRRVLSGRYELRSLLGRGGMAEVWHAVDRRLGREVAVKLLTEAGLADPTVPVRFDREAHIAARLSHPNIVAVHDVGADDGVPYLVMEFVPGSNVADRAMAGPLEIVEAVRITIQACAALEAAAEAGVVHRDMKPANILLTETGQVKVCDFGIAWMSGNALGELTGSSQMIGTSAFMAPEQVTGGAVDARTDLYGLGCVLFAMLTGRPPFLGDSPMQIAWHQVERTPEPVSSLRDGIPGDLDRLLRSMLAKFPADRPSGPAEVRAALETLDLDTTPAPAPGDAPSSPTRFTATVAVPTRTLNGSAGRRPGVLAAATAVAVAGVSAVVLATRPGPPEQPGPRAAPAVSSPAPSPSRTTAPQEEATTAAPPPPPAPAPEAPRDPLADARELIDAQVDAGNLDAKDARDLAARLDKIGQETDEGDRDKAAKRAADLRERIDKLEQQGKLLAPGADAILAGLDGVA